MTDSSEGSRFREVRWSWATKEHITRTAYLGVDGRVSVTELLAYMAEIAPDVPPEEIGLNFATATWTRPANDDELAAQAARDAEHSAQREAWERETLARLLEKYGLPVAE